MHVIAVVEQTGGQVRSALQRAVGGRAYVVTPDEVPPPYDIIVWAQNPCPVQRMPLSARALAVNGDNASQALTCCRCDTVLTYGFGGRDTLTPSATLGQRELLSLQRGLVSLSGSTVDPCEIAVDVPGGDLETRMAVTAACLLLDGLSPHSRITR